MSNQVPSPRSQ